MSEDWAIKIEHLSKVYKIFDKPTDRVKEALNPFRKRYSRDFYALNDVSLTIKKGETVGIIGKNGAGKSTILKIITGVLTPTSGSVQVNGRIASLLELGAGFNPEMTGIENIYMNGTIMGYSKEEMDDRVQDIIDFADIGEFIHQPVKMYSSGMFARLAFAVNAFVEPDILIVDEALSVGDIGFQKKCFAQFEVLKKRGATILFVSHDLESIKLYCSRTVYIQNGKISHDGESKFITDLFLKETRINVNDDSKSSFGDYSDFSPCEFSLIENYPYYTASENRYGNKKLQITHIKITNVSKENDVIHIGDNVKIELLIKAVESADNVLFGYGIRNIRGNNIYVFNGSKEFQFLPSMSVKEGKTYVVTITHKILLVPGDYLYSFTLLDGENDNEVIDTRYECIYLKVASDGCRYAGIFHNKAYVDVSEWNGEL